MFSYNPTGVLLVLFLHSNSLGWAILNQDGHRTKGKPQTIKGKLVSQSPDHGEADMRCAPPAT